MNKSPGMLTRVMKSCSNILSLTQDEKISIFTNYISLKETKK
jgi:hypothetical protein